MKEHLLEAQGGTLLPLQAGGVGASSGSKGV